MTNNTKELLEELNQYIHDIESSCSLAFIGSDIVEILEKCREHIATQPRPDKPLITPEANKGLSQLRDLVIILDDDAKAEIKDLVETDFGFGFVTDVQDNNFNLALYTGNRNILKDGAWFRNFSPKIIQRQGKPCIYRSQLNKQEGGCE